MMINKYPGTCTGCGQHVEAGDGFYDYGDVWCEDPYVEKSDRYEVDGVVVIVSERGCERSRRGEAKRAVLAQRKREAHAASPEGIAEAKAEAERLARRAEEFAKQDAAWAARGLCRCERCGGAGGSRAWPGWACYDCGGAGAVPVDFHAR